MPTRSRTHLPAPRLEHLRQGQLRRPSKPQEGIDFNQQLVQEPDGDGAPLHNDIVIRGEKRNHFHRLLTLAEGVAPEGREAPLRVLVFQGQHAGIHEQSAVPILGEAREKFDARELDVQQFGHGHHQGIAQPLGEFVKGDDVFPRLMGRRRRHGRTGPGVAQRHPVDLRPRGGPDRGQPVGQHRPEGGNGDDGHGGGPRGRVGEEMVCAVVLVPARHRMGTFIYLAFSPDDHPRQRGSRFPTHPPSATGAPPVLPSRRSGSSR